MVDWSNWINWDAGTALMYTIIGVGIYVVCKTADLKNKVKSPLLLGLAATLTSCFTLGLYAIVPAFAYLTVTYSLDFWVYKINKSQEIKK